MKRVASVVLVCAWVLTSTLAPAQAPDEQEVVRLMLVDALVTDGSGAPVRGLAKADFQMTVENAIQPIDTLDEICMTDGKIIPGLEPRIVLAFDYYALTRSDRKRVVESAATLLQEKKRPDDKVMIVSITNQLRVEQRFTDDLNLLLDTLERMEYDITLATRQFGHVKAKQYFGSMATLMDVAAAYEGSKAVILYSATVTAPDGTDELFRDVATRAAIGKTVIHPAGLRGLKTENPRQGLRALGRFASDTGGSVGENGVDATKLYDTVRNEMMCRYSLGFYLGADQTQAPVDIRISVARPRVTVRYPASVRLWSADETRASRQRAAFSDPERFEHPLVRMLAYPAGPDTPTTWSTMLAVHAPIPVGPQGDTLNVSAQLYRDGEIVGVMSRQIEFEPKTDGSAMQPFTLFGEASTKKGQHELRVVLSKPDEKQVVASSTRFELPEIPWGELMLRGPVLARVEPEGLALRSSEAVGVLLRETIGEQSFEPLTVHEIEPSDTLLLGWQACRVKQEDPAEAGALVERVIVDADGTAVHTLPPVRLKLEGEKVTKCHRGLDKLDPGTLARGEYIVEVLVTQDGERRLERSAPLLVD